MVQDLSIFGVRSRTVRSNNINKFWTLLLTIVCLVNSSVAQCTGSAGCVPEAGDLAFGRVVTATSSCVGNEFCLPGQSECSLCDSQDLHNIKSINDDDPDTYWVSNNTESGVMLQVDFEAPMSFYNMEMTWVSLRPRSMVLEYSTDFGQSWWIYRYYAADCQMSFMENNTIITPSTVFMDATPICTSMESSIIPGPVTFSTSSHMVPAEGYSIITNLRVDLKSQFNEFLEDDRFKVYAVSEWVINGTCFCNGHGSSCVPLGDETTADGKVYSGCMCEHNTAGTHCSECEVGFNNVPWSQGTEEDANACQECDCSGHALDCVYQDEIMTSVCTNCTDNTTGNQCDQCLSGFYEDTTVLQNSPDICKPCECNLAGTVEGDGTCNEMAQCNCKEGVTSLNCGVCENGFWNLSSSGCIECDCDENGSEQEICDKETGQCMCKSDVIGMRCDTCNDTYFDITSGCKQCGCSLISAESLVCDKSSIVGQCPCKPNLVGISCNQVAEGYYFKALDSILFEAEDAEVSQETDFVFPSSTSNQIYTGRGFISLVSGESAVFTIDVPRDSQYEVILRYKADVEIAGVSISLTSLESVTTNVQCEATNSSITAMVYPPATLAHGSSHHVIDSVCLFSTVQYQLTVTYEPSSTDLHEWMLDSVLLMPDFKAVSSYLMDFLDIVIEIVVEPCFPRSASDHTLFECQDNYFYLSIEFYGQVFECDCSQFGTEDPATCDAFGGSCIPCKEGVTGRDCSQCENDFFNFTTSGCQDPCNCNELGSKLEACNMETGQCDCQAGVGGLSCDQCLPGFFSLTASGCTPCGCSEIALSDECSDDGQCECNSGSAGLQCDHCETEFYNSSGFCVPCNCHPLGSSSNVCDVTTGQCDCVMNTIGVTCDQCSEEFFMTDDYYQDRCTRCICFGRSDDCEAEANNYQLGGIVSDFKTLCGLSSSNCSNGWQLLTENGEEAASFGPNGPSGLLYILFFNDRPELHAPQKFLGNQQFSLGMMFVVEVIILDVYSDMLLTNSIEIKISGPRLNATLIGIFPSLFTAILDESNIALQLSIPFSEGYWYYGGSDMYATDLEILAVLSNLTSLSFTAQFTNDLIEFVTVEQILLVTRIEAFQAPVLNVEVIQTNATVENCVCPEGYEGQFCQDCAKGFARPSQNPGDPCVKCNCNNLADNCDVNTAICLDCEGNSEGNQCESCIKGFYGDPTQGTQCQQCECPTETNSYSPTCFLDTDGLSTCDNCSIGYAGRNCEVCLDGYFGNPTIGHCITCECNGNVDPALGPTCNTTTGLCLNCLNNSMGFECQRCIPGYYGDITAGVPCQDCGCNEIGITTPCDLNLGTCFCKENVIGDQCTECADGFWGLTDGQEECIPCDCCANGSVSNLCNKATGQCDCLPNVGDDKCCMCAPGFFNFKPLIGCEACNCSDLATSIECDQVTGDCNCQEGAIGSKCDDCAFGYSGKVPNCQVCHECFQQWYDIVFEMFNYLTTQQQRVNFLIGLFEGCDQVCVETSFFELQEDLQNAIEILSNITIDTSELDALEVSSYEINQTLYQLGTSIDEVNQQVLTTIGILEPLASFNGTVNGTTVAFLKKELLLQNETAFTIYQTASDTLVLLMQNKLLVVQLREEAMNLNKSVIELLPVLNTTSSAIENITEALYNFQNSFHQLRSNLTNADMNTERLATLLLEIHQEVNHTCDQLQGANTSLDTIFDEIQSKSTEADGIFELVKQLNSSVGQNIITAQQSLSTVNTLYDVSNSSLEDVESLTGDLYDGILKSYEVEQNLTAVKYLAETLLNSSLPSLESVLELSKQIEATILSEEDVQNILQSTEIVNPKAKSVLQITQNASMIVRDVELLLEQLASDINCTNSSLVSLSKSLAQLEEDLQNFEDNIAELTDVSSLVEELVAEGTSIYYSTVASIQETYSVGMQARDEAHSILLQVCEISDESVDLRDEFQEFRNNYTTLQSNIDESHSEALEYQEQSKAVLEDAVELNDAVNTTVSFQDLQNLMKEFFAEEEEIDSLISEVAELQSELEELTRSFIAAADQPNNCYRRT